MSDEHYRGPYQPCYSERETLITALAIEKAIPEADVIWSQIDPHSWAVMTDEATWPQFRALNGRWVDVVDEACLRSVLFRICDLN